MIPLPLRSSTNATAVIYTFTSTLSSLLLKTLLPPQRGKTTPSPCVSRNHAGILEKRNWLYFQPITSSLLSCLGMETWVNLIRSLVMCHTVDNPTVVISDGLVRRMNRKDRNRSVDKWARLRWVPRAIGVRMAGGPSVQFSWAGKDPYMLWLILWPQKYKKLATIDTQESNTSVEDFFWISPIFCTFNMLDG